MEIGKLRRDMAAIEGGRWVGADEVPGLGDLRVKMAGTVSAKVRDAIAAKQRAGADMSDAMRGIIASMCLVDITGLTNNGKPVMVDAVREMLASDDPALEPLGLLMIDVVRVVDASREADAKVSEKN